jgi:hypothetical protein
MTSKIIKDPASTNPLYNQFAGEAYRSRISWVHEGQYQDDPLLDQKKSTEFHLTDWLDHRIIVAKKGL